MKGKRRSSEFLFDTEPIEAWRVFGWSRAKSAAQLFDLAALAPAGANPYAWARLPRLASVGVDHHWVENQAKTAECENAFAGDHDHAPASSDCSCGLWGVKTEAQAWWHARAYNADVLARVALWGKFVEHANGWRAAAGYPLELFAITRNGKSAVTKEELGERYGVPAGEKELVVAPPPESTLAPSMQPFSTMINQITSVGSATATAWTATRPMFTFFDPEPWPREIVHPSHLWAELQKPEGVMPVMLYPHVYLSQE